MSDIRRNIERLQPSLHFVHWNQQGWKTGLCSVPPIGQVGGIPSVCVAYIPALQTLVYRAVDHSHIIGSSPKYSCAAKHGLAQWTIQTWELIALFHQIQE